MRRLNLLFKLKLLSSWHVARLLGFRFIWTQTEEEKKAASRLRYQVYKDEGYIDPEQHDNGELKDKYDSSSDSLLVTWKGKPVGTVRVIRDSPVKFPTENLFNIRLNSNRTGTIEISRLCILKEFRKKNFILRKRVVMGGMAAQLYFYSKKQNIGTWILNMPEKLKKSFESMGVAFVKIPEEELLEQHHREREIIDGYFKKAVLYPYLLNIDDL